MVEEQGGKAAREAAEARLTNGNQLHHLIPDGVAQKNPLVQEALKRIPEYTIDRGSNMLDMPNIKDASGQIIHNGSHPLFDAYVNDELAKALSKVTHEGEIPLGQVKPVLLDSALREVETRLRTSILDKTLPAKILRELEGGGMKLSSLPSGIGNLENA